MYENDAGTDIRALLVFRVVAERGGFAAAQAALGVAQSSISERIAKLEGDLGVRLCDRGRAGFRLTEAGTAVLEASTRLFAALDAFRLATSELTGRLSGRLGIGTLDNTVADPDSPLVGALRRFAARDHDVRIDLTVGSPADLERGVLEGELHAAIGIFPVHVAGLRYRRLYTEEHRLCASRDHPLCVETSARKRRTAIRTAPAVSVAFLARKTDPLLEGVCARVENVEACAMLLLSGGYIGFLPSHHAAPWIEAGELVELEPKLRQRHDFELAVRRGGAHSAALRAFLTDLGAARSS